MASLLHSVPAATAYRCIGISRGMHPRHIVRRLRASSCSSGSQCPPETFESAYTYSTDLYELLGVEKDASAQEIRRSYRWLQKKCHPDIAGPPGHNMSILLNHAYSTLSDPNRRAAYDRTIADSWELKGYTGIPLYSKWFGPAEENRAVFVDESRCVGCLKCALVAPNTFAIETKFGRARAVGQWADPESVVEAAIDACPVDCISWVEKNKLAMMEFVMSKMPRFPVGIEAHSSGGVKTSDVFKEVERYLKMLQQNVRRNSSNLTETASQRKARLDAMDEIQARAGRWWYYFIGKPAAEDKVTSRIRHNSHGAVVPSIFYGTGRETTNAARRFETRHIKFSSENELPFQVSSGNRFRNPSSHANDDEYWTPVIGTSFPDTITHIAEDDGIELKRSNRSWPISKPITGWVRDLVSGMPVGIAGIAAWYVGVTCRSGVVILSDSELGLGPVPVEWMQTLEMQIILTALVWYLIGACSANALVLVVHMIQGRNDNPLDEDTL